MKGTGFAVVRNSMRSGPGLIHSIYDDEYNALDAQCQMIASSMGETYLLPLDSVDELRENAVKLTHEYLKYQRVVQKREYSEWEKIEAIQVPFNK